MVVRKLQYLMMSALAAFAFAGCDDSAGSIPADETPMSNPPVSDPEPGPIDEPGPDTEPEPEGQPEPEEQPEPEAQPEPEGQPDPEPDPVEEPDEPGAPMCEDDDALTARPLGWTRASHCKGEPPNYELLFPNDSVHRIDLIIEAADYQAMLDNLDDLYGGQQAMPGGSLDGGEDPMYVPIQLAFNGLVWTDVGMRFKGNSSLQSAYRRGVRKMSFRLNFDKYEDDNPRIDNQRFYGFKKMTFSNGFSDPSLIRDKLGADIFRGAGVPAARGAFARIYVDVGAGPVYFGLYTMIEDPSDELLGVQFDDDGGNLYKPEGDGATWNHQDAAIIARDFEKKTNEDDTDWSDIESAIAALHADRGNPAEWRAGLEAVVDVPAFLQALAVNQVMVNWDSYGYMNHNYYVYADPSRDGRLVWFPWDLNESMLVKGRRGPDPTDVMMSDVGSEWPLVRFVLDDPVYEAAYLEYVAETIDGAFEEERVVAMAEAYRDLIAPYVMGEDGEQAPHSNLRNQAEFQSGSAELIEHIRGRQQAVRQVLAQP